MSKSGGKPGIKSMNSEQIIKRIDRLMEQIELLERHLDFATEEMTEEALGCIDQAHIALDDLKLCVQADQAYRDLNM